MSIPIGMGLFLVQYIFVEIVGVNHQSEDKKKLELQK